VRGGLLVGTPALGGAAAPPYYNTTPGRCPIGRRASRGANRRKKAKRPCPL